MEWLEYCNKHLKHVDIIMSNAKLATRMQRRSSMYKSCVKLLDDIHKIQESIKYYNYVSKKDMIKMFGKITLWCDYFQSYIVEDAVRHEIQLLASQCKKHVKKNTNRYNSMINIHGINTSDLNWYGYDDDYYGY